MARGIKINLDEISDFLNDATVDNDVALEVRTCITRFDKIKDYYKSMGKTNTYDKQIEVIDEIDDGLKDIRNNLTELFRDLEKYHEKMSEGDIAKESEDAFASSNLDDFSMKILRLKDKLSEVNLEYSTAYAVHDNAKFDNYISKTLDTFDEDDQKIRELSNEFAQRVHECKANHGSIKENLDELEINFEKIEDWYDRDFDMSDHIRNNLDFVASVVLDVGITALVVTFGGPEIIAVGIYAGVMGLAGAASSIESGATGEEAIVHGVTSAAMNAVPGTMSSKMNFDGVATNKLNQSLNMERFSKYTTKVDQNVPQANVNTTNVSTRAASDAPQMNKVDKTIENNEVNLKSTNTIQMNTVDKTIVNDLKSDIKLNYTEKVEIKDKLIEKVNEIGVDASIDALLQYSEDNQDINISDVQYYLWELFL